MNHGRFSLSRKAGEDDDDNSSNVEAIVAPVAFSMNSLPAMEDMPKKPSLRVSRESMTPHKHVQPPSEIHKVSPSTISQR